MGVAALMSGVFESALHYSPGAELVVLDYGKQALTVEYRGQSGVVPVELVNMRFSKRFYLPNNILTLLFRTALVKLGAMVYDKTKTFPGNKWLKAIEQAQVVGSLAGGDSFSDIYGIRRLLYVSLPQLLVLLAGKDLALLPQTLGPYDGIFAKALARTILKRASIVFSRDRNGLVEMQRLLGKDYDANKFRFCYDVGFVVQPVKPSSIDLHGLDGWPEHEAPVAGVNINGLLWTGGYTRANQFGLKTDYRSLVSKLIGHLVQNKNVTVLLVPHVFEDDSNFESDSAACEELYTRLKQTYGSKIGILRGRYEVGELQMDHRAMQLFLRFAHACVHRRHLTVCSNGFARL